MDNFANFASSQVVTAPSPATTGTTLDIVPSHGARFPAAPFNVFVCDSGALPVCPEPQEAEVVRVTAGPPGDTFTIMRTQESSAARSIRAGDKIYLAPTVKAFTDIQATVPNASYRTLLQSSGSHTAARVAGTYGMGQGDPLAISGTGTLYPLNIEYLAAADYPTLGGLAPKLRVRARLYTNDVAPTGNFTVGLHPITRPATSGGAGLCIYTIGTAVVGSTNVFIAPAADASLPPMGTDFAFPADGHYVLGVVTTATVATSAHVHIAATLQLRNN